MHAKLLYSHIAATLRTIASQAPLPMGFSKQEYWSGLACLSPGSNPHLLH